MSPSEPARLPDSPFHTIAPVLGEPGPSANPGPSGRTLRLAALVLGVVAALIVAAGLITRAEENARLRDWTEAQAVPTVAVTKPGDAGDAATLSLPGRLEAYIRAPIYARVSGYLKSWKYDIGAPVKSGQLLAEIDAPDLDQQLAQAEADLSTADANLTLATTTAQTSSPRSASGTPMTATWPTSGCRISTSSTSRGYTL